ncbi:unnamed protein product, partial [Symbiodinium sp. CCMP2456]
SEDRRHHCEVYRGAAGVGCLRGCSRHIHRGAGWQQCGGECRCCNFGCSCSSRLRNG